jgi:undecaprenyl-diphosphatase
MTDLNCSLFRLVNDVWTSPTLDPFMILLGSINEYGVVWLVLLGALAALGGKTGRWAALAGLAAMVVGLAFSEVLKSIVMQPRPFVSLTDVRLLVSPPGSYSFPSVNATYAFAAFSGTSLTARRLLGRLPVWGWGFLALAVAASYSRVYVGVHYPSDVLSGAIIGLSFGWLVTSIGLRFCEVEVFDERSTLHDEGDRTES